MTAGTYVRIAELKAFSKIVNKRFAMKLSTVHHIVCQASGYHGFQEVYVAYDSGDDLEQLQMSDLPAWLRRLGFALGSDLEELLRPSELETWFRQIHGIYAPEFEESTDDAD